MSRIGVGYVEARRGSFRKAIDVLGKILEIPNQDLLTNAMLRYFPVLGYAYAMSGQLDDALPLLKESVEKAILLGQQGDLSQRVG
jgi:tetratricopeptide (TPR) repeat protein